MRKHSKKLGMLIITTALVFTLAGCGEAGKVVKQIELGNYYSEQGDYASAITAFETALSIDQYSIEGYQGLIQAMVNGGSSQDEINAKVQDAIAATKELAAQENGLTEEQKAAVEDFYLAAADSLTGENRQETLNAGSEILGSDSTVSDKYIEEMKELIQKYQDGKNFEAAKEYADKLASALPDSEAAKDLISQVETQYNEEQKYVDTLLKAQRFIEAQDWQGLADFSETEEVTALAEKIGDVGNYTYLAEGSNSGMGIGYYSMEGCDCNEWYYGNLVDGKREGQGGWYWAKNDDAGLYVDNYVGNWENDSPNGAGHWYIYMYDHVSEDKDITVVNGLLDGTYTEEFVTESGIHLTGTLTLVQGKYQSVELEDWLKEYLNEGEIAICVIPYTETDGKESVYWLRIPADFELTGISHFR